MIRTQGLVKAYGRLHAVDGVDLDVREGDRYGFLGPNGSGKTTTVRMLLGLVLPTSGEMEVLGTSKVRSVLTEVGAMVEGPAAYGHLSGRANLALSDQAGRGTVRRTRKARVDEALERVGLAGVDRRPVKQYSLGMRQRLGLATALLQKPRLLVLDEPTNGLDPQGIREFRELLIELNEQGTTVFLSSHLLAEIEALCTRIGVIDRGRLVAQDDLAALTAPTGRTEVHTADVDAAVRLLGERVELVEGERLLVRDDDSATLNASLVDEGIRVRELSKLVRRPRTWVLVLLLCALPTIVAVFVKVSDIAPRPGTGPAFLSAVLDNGTLFPAAALAIVLPLFLPVAVAVVAGESVAGEAQSGTLRYLLIRPVGRTRLLVAKLIAVLAFTLISVTTVAAVSYAVGLSLFGSAPVSSISGSEFTGQDAAVRITLTVLYVGWSMLGVAAVALFLSTVTDSPLVAALGAVGVLVASTLLVTLEAAQSVQPYLPTRYWLAFIDLYRSPVVYRDLVRGVALQAVYIAVLLTAAWANFTTKDVTS